MAATALKDKGWHLTEEGIEQCKQAGGRSDVDGLIKTALDTDLKEIGQKWLPEDINRGRADYVQGPGMLQVQKISNISAPKDHEDSQAAPRLLKLVLTDGHIKCCAIETEQLKDLGLNTPPGSKILLKATTDVEHGFLLLTNKNIQYCGGRVSKLVEGWELKKKLSKQTRSNFGSGEEPPPFVPFGQRIDSSAYHKTRRDNFKSLEPKQAEKTEDDEFEQQRKATIAEAMKAKEDGQSKKFGGGLKSVATDHDIAQITEMGFRPDEAANALKLHNSNVPQAIEYLLGNRGRGQHNGRALPPTNRQSSFEGRDGDRGRGRRERKDDDSGGPGKGRRGRDVEESTDSKPSGPATLFDFLETKFPVNDSKGTKKDEKSTFSKSNDRTSYITDHDRYTGPSGATHSQSDSYSQSNRPKSLQNVPPRFVNKSRPDTDQGYDKGQGRYKDERSESGRDRSKNNSSENSTRQYEDRNYSDRTYNDGRYSDRNHDRGYGDRERNYGNRDRNYGDRDSRNYGEKDRNYGNKGGYGDRDYGDKDKNYGDRGRGYGERDRNYGDRNYGDRDRNYGGEKNKNYGPKDKGNYGDSSDRNKSYNDRKPNVQEGNRGEVKKNTNNNSTSSAKSNYNSDYKGKGDKSHQEKESVDSLKSSQNHAKPSNTSHGESQNSSHNYKQTENGNQGNHVPNKGGNYDKSQNVKQESNSQTSSYKKNDSYSKGGNPHQDLYPKGVNLNPQQTGYRNNTSQVYGANNNYGQPVYNPNYNGTQQAMVQNIHTSMGQYQQHPEFIYTETGYRNNTSQVYGANNNYGQPVYNPNYNGTQQAMEQNIHTSMGQYQQHPEFIYTEVPAAYGLKRGDKVMAKYWEDSRFYEAVVEVVAPNLPTCVVTFVEYGNSEEILLTDVQPLSVPQMHQASPMLQPPDLSVPPPQIYFAAGPPPPHMAQAGIDEVMQGIGSLEFRRGGGGTAYHRKEAGRPAQQLYQPPGQRR